MTEEKRQSEEDIRPINQNFKSNISCQLSHMYIRLIMTRNSLTIFEMQHYIFLVKISQNNNWLQTDLPLFTYRLYEIPLRPVYLTFEETVFSVVKRDWFSVNMYLAVSKFKWQQRHNYIDCVNNRHIFFLKNLNSMFLNYALFLVDSFNLQQEGHGSHHSLGKLFQSINVFIMQ